MLEILELKWAETYQCGSNGFAFEGMFPIIVSTIVNIIKIGVPILLIILGMLDLGKAVMAQKEDEIKKGQSLFIKRLIAAMLVFLVTFAVQMLVRFFTNNDDAKYKSCIKCFITGECTEKSEQNDVSGQNS